MRQFRIVERNDVVGDHVDTDYIIEEKGWFFWNKVGRKEYDYDGCYFVAYRFQTASEAQANIEAICALETRKREARDKVKGRERVIIQHTRCRGDE